MAESPAVALILWSRNREEDLAEMKSALAMVRRSRTARSRTLWLNCARTFGRCVVLDNRMIMGYLAELSLCDIHVLTRDCDCVPTF